MGQLALTKMFVVVDEDINVHDINDVIWAITTRADAARDTIIINNTPTDTLDPASPLVNLGSKMGIDATQKTKEEGYEREMQKLRGEHSDQHAIEENIKKLIADEESIETDEERRARDLAEDAAMEEFLKKSKGEK